MFSSKYEHTGITSTLEHMIRISVPSEHTP